MRSQVAAVIEANPREFHQGVLGRGNGEYVAWIQGRGAWGGGVEVEVLGVLYGVEVVVVVVEEDGEIGGTEEIKGTGEIKGIGEVKGTGEIKGTVVRFCQNRGYNTRVFLKLEKGHYDALAMAVGGGGEERDDQVVFSVTDEEVMRKMRGLVGLGREGEGGRKRGRVEWGRGVRVGSG